MKQYPLVDLSAVKMRTKRKRSLVMVVVMGGLVVPLLALEEVLTIVARLFPMREACHKCPNKVY